MMGYLRMSGAASIDKTTRHPYFYIDCLRFQLSRQRQMNLPEGPIQGEVKYESEIKKDEEKEPGSQQRFKFYTS